MDRVTVWRPSPWLVGAFQVMGLAMIVWAAWPLPGEPYLVDAGPRAQVILMGLAILFLPRRCKIVLKGDELVVQGLFFRRRALLEDVENVEPSYGGLNIHLTGDRMIQATLVGEKSNVSGWLGRRTRSDAQGEDLLQLARKRRREGETP